MSNSAANKPEESVSRVRHYADILNPLFWDDAFYEIERMFEFVCTLVRASGLKDKGWDSYTESIDLLNDLGHLQELELPGDKFPLPSHTRARFALIAYSHAVEMDFPYELLANLLRLRLKLKYSVRPLSHLDRPIEKKHNGKKIITKILRASPDRKITEIEELSKKAGLPDVGNALRGIYNSTIRNAVYHSDYAVHENSLRLLSGNWLSKRQRVYTPLIPFDDLAEITNEAMAFHSALYLLWKRARNSFTDFRGKFMPYDQHYKANILAERNGRRMWPWYQW